MGRASLHFFSFTFGITLIIGLSLAGMAHCDPAHDILEKARVKLQSRCDQAHVVLKIIESSGDIKTREMNLETLETKHGFRAIVRMTAPAGDKGTALLTIVHGAKHDQWLYLPASNQIRRIAVANSSAGILGSELSPEDLNPAAIKGATIKLLKKTKTSASIQLIPPKGKSIYSRVVTQFALPTYLPTKTEYYTGSTLRKTVEFKDYKKFAGHIYRALKVHIWNLVKHRGTDLLLSKIKVNGHLSKRDFTPNALKNVW